MSFINGQGRIVLVDTVVTVAAVPTSVNFGQFQVPQFAGLCGMVKCDSSFAATLEFQYKNNAGVTLTTSTLLVTSGIVVNEFNPGAHVSIALTGVTSNTPARVYITGLPIR